LLVVGNPLSTAGTQLVAPGCFRVVVAHLKGGQAKTKTVFLTALELAEHGMRVLCRDLDHDTASLTHTFRDKGALFDDHGVGRLGRAIALGPYGSPLPFQPHVELIDTPPTKEGSLAGAARADAIIIPAEPEHEAGRALQVMLEAIELVRASSPYLRYIGLLPTRVRSRLSDHAAYLRVMSQLARSVGCPVLEPIMDSRWVRRGSNREHQYRPLAMRILQLAQEHRRYAA
jgi:cellulose biosynthesis protein BcsQ